ncbi:hypothetical protein ACP4OV_018455 [Aristida adscensionis]
MNLRNLERVPAREEEVKKKAVVHKATYDGPTIRFCSKDGESHLEFINGASFGSELCTTSAPYPEKPICVVTGLPAKYYIGLTHTLSLVAAFSFRAYGFIRSGSIRAYQGVYELKTLKDNSAYNQFQWATTEGQLKRTYFYNRKRRIELRPPSVSEGRMHGRRFGRIPALDMVDED